MRTRPELPTASELRSPARTGRLLGGQVAVVTGGSRGIGRAIAQALAAEGAHVVAVAHTDERGCQETVRSVDQQGGKATYMLADVSVGAQVDQLFATILEHLEKVDVLVNCAGIQPRETFLEAAEETWDCVMATNLRSVFLCSQRAARAMVARGGQGAIVSVASHAALTYIRGMSPAYHASKAAIVQMTRYMAVELAPHGIRVNAVAPGLVETEVTHSVLADPAREAMLRSQIPLGRVGQPTDVAGAVVFLASPHAGWMTGETLVINGGQALW